MTPASARRPAPGLGQEHAPPGEEDAVRAILNTIHQAYEHDFGPGVRPALRDQHPKSHGCVRAEFSVEEHLPQALRHGLFAGKATYPAWIRFSSSSPKPQPDSVKDAHGMSIKLMDVPGDKVLEAERAAGTQDFIIANSKVFFCRNAVDYVVLASRMAEGKLPRFFFGINPLKWRIREFVNLMTATQKTVYNPLRIQYWSQTPYRLGPHAVKYSARPASGAGDEKHNLSGPDYLEDAMAAQLASGEALFDFMVQVQTDPVSMPVEDPVVRWKERQSPFQKVATIRIPRQEFSTDARRDFADNLSFTPWHSLPEHAPLGGINRVRRVTYEAVSMLRHQKNAAPREEPSPDVVA